LLADDFLNVEFHISGGLTTYNSPERVFTAIKAHLPLQGGYLPVEGVHVPVITGKPLFSSGSTFEEGCGALNCAMPIHCYDLLEWNGKCVLGNYVHLAHKNS
jgi:hypothetical protein